MNYSCWGVNLFLQLSYDFLYMRDSYAIEFMKIWLLWDANYRNRQFSFKIPDDSFSKI